MVWHDRVQRMPRVFVSYTTLPTVAPILPVDSNIRETLVKMFASSDSGVYSTRDQHFDTMIPASHLPVDPSTCVFWSAIALGSLVQGRPVESVRNGVPVFVSPAKYRDVMAVRLAAMLSRGGWYELKKMFQVFFSSLRRCLHLLCIHTPISI